MSEPTRPSPLTVLLAFVLDVVLVVAFAATGRASHDSDIWAGLWQTAWPFVAALAVGWVVSIAWRAPLAPWRTGVPLWAVTVLGGMLLRAVSGQGTAIPFIVVATVTVFLLLVGWRLLARLVIAARRRRGHSAGHSVGTRPSGGAGITP